MKQNKMFTLNEKETELVKRYADMLGCTQSDVVSRALLVMDTAVREHRKVRYARSSDTEQQKLIAFDFLSSALHLFHLTDAVQN